MRLLLDTHVVLGMVKGEAGRLRPAVVEVLDQQHSFFVSVASLWEIAIKWRLRKLPLATPPARLPDLLADLGISVLPITPEHAFADIEPEPATRDPFDRLLLGVCRAEALRLVTTDHALITHPLAVRI